MPLWSNIDEEAGKPKFLSSADKADTLGISADETATQKATHAGWVLSRTGTGGRAGRVFNETLVAMGSMTGDNDTVDPDPVITIGTQPQNVSVVEPAAATFSVVATATRGAALSYLWQVSTNSGSTWSTVSGTVATDSSVTIDPTEVAMNGYQYRCVVSAAGADSVTSSAATLTVTA